MTRSTDVIGGANFALADASVHFISQSIEHKVYRALSTKNWGETVDTRAVGLGK